MKTLIKLYNIEVFRKNPVFHDFFFKKIMLKEKFIPTLHPNKEQFL